MKLIVVTAETFSNLALFHPHTIDYPTLLLCNNYLSSIFILILSPPP